MMTKAYFRDMYKKKRFALDSEQLEAYQIALLQQLAQLDWKSKTYVHTFLPILKQREPDTWRFIRYLQEMYPMLNVVISRSDPKDASMQHVLLREDIQFVENSWGILEPTGGQDVDESLLDVVLVPLLVADRQGNRVGYGKGFYDRFLVKCRTDCCKIGVSFFSPVDQIADIDTLDVRLDMLITPSEIYRFI